MKDVAGQPSAKNDQQGNVENEKLGEEKYLGDLKQGFEIRWAHNVTSERIVAGIPLKIPLLHYFVLSRPAFFTEKR